MKLRRPEAPNTIAALSAAPVITHCKASPRTLTLAALMASLFATGPALRGQTLGQALDATNLVWTTGGNPAWFAQSRYTHDGVFAAASYNTAVDDVANAWLRTTVTGPAAVTFWWKVSCLSLESIGLKFSVGSTMLANIKGDTDWQRRTFYVPAGSQTLEWYCVMSWSGTRDANAGFVDEVSVGAPTPPSITQQPTNQTVRAGTTATIAATLEGTEPWTFQWKFKGFDIPGATQQMLVLTNVQAQASGDYQLVVTNPVGAVTSQVANLSVNVSEPRFVVEPTSAVVALSSNLTLTAAATGSEPITWQWYRSSNLLPGANTNILSLTNLQPSDSGSYLAVASNAAGSSTSAVAVVTVADAPVFTSQPPSQGAPPGATVRFSATAVGSQSLSFQWYFEGSPLPNATDSTTWVTNAQLGSYWVAAANVSGATTSAVATLTYSPVAVWGRTAYDMDIVPSAATNVIMMTGGDNHRLALRSDGTVVAWGANYWNNQAVVPAGLSNVIAVSAGSTHSLALRDDGTLALWGTTMGDGKSEVPPEATNIVAIAKGCGSWHCVALKADGTVVDWGFSRYGWSPVPASATNVVAVAAGPWFGGAWRADGSFVAWGRPGEWATIPSAVTNLDELEATWDDFVATRRDDTIVEWASSATVKPGYIAATGGGRHILGLQPDGSVRGWRTPYYINSYEYQQTNVPPWVSNAVAVSASSYASAAVVGSPGPFFGQQPRSCVAFDGDSVRFIASVGGAHPLNLQWYRNGAPIPGATRRWLILENLRAPDNADYVLVAINAYGSATSRVVRVTSLLPAPPKIVGMTTSLALPAGATLVLEVAATGTEPMSHQWLFNNVPLTNGGRVSGATTRRLSITAIQANDFGNYQVLITNAPGQALSPKVNVRAATASEALAEAVDLPGWYLSTSGSGFFYEQQTTHDGSDAAQTAPVADGGTAGLTLTNKGNLAVSFWWKVSSETNADYLTFQPPVGTPARISGEAGWQERSFWVPIATSWTARWTYSKNTSGFSGQDCGWVDQIRVGPATPPSLAYGPQSAAIFGTTPAALTVGVETSSTVPLVYRWFRIGTASPVSQSSTTYELTNSLQTTIAGQYFVTASNMAGTVTSPLATLVAVPANAKSQPVLTRLPDGTSQVTWSYGTLESARQVEGPWEPVPGVTSPYTMPVSGTNGFYRVRLF